MASSKIMLVAALDFGTTYSGYAFSLKHDYKKDPLKIHANQAWYLSCSPSMAKFAYSFSASNPNETTFLLLSSRRHVGVFSDISCLASSKIMLVAALDFGTTYSGYAFSLKHDYKKDPLKIHANQAWNAGGRQLMSEIILSKNYTEMREGWHNWVNNNRPSLDKYD
jgi:hypothetical protein